MNKKILVIGSTGQLGQCFVELSQKLLNHHWIFIDFPELDLSDTKNIESYLLGLKQIDIIINTAAYTAVDNAEKESTLADLINHKAVEVLANYAKKTGTQLVHFSTDYVFNGQNFKPYLETDQTNPINTYGSTKLKGENAMLRSECSGFIIRTSWVFSEYGNNFVKTMLRLGQDREQLTIVADQIGSPTYAMDLANATFKLLEQPHETTALYHFTNEGVCSWYDFAQSIFELSSLQCKTYPIESKDYPTPAQRPYYSVLNKNKYKNITQANIPHWRASLAKCLEKLEFKND